MSSKKLQKEYIEHSNPFNPKILPKGSKVISVKKKCQFNKNCFKGDLDAIKIELIKEYVRELLKK